MSLFEPTSEALESVRHQHQMRDVNERILDEISNEPITNDISKWSNNPFEFDFKCIDTTPELQLHSDFEEKKFAFYFSEPFDSKNDVDKIAQLFGNYDDHDFDNEIMHFALLLVDKNQRGKCLGNYLLRELVNYADTNCKYISLEANPLENKRGDWKKGLQNLVNLYGQFGFYAIGSSPNKTVKQQEMWRDPPDSCFL